MVLIKVRLNMISLALPRRDDPPRPPGVGPRFGGLLSKVEL